MKLEHAAYLVNNDKTINEIGERVAALGKILEDFNNSFKDNAEENLDQKLLDIKKVHDELDKLRAELVDLIQSRKTYIRDKGIVETNDERMRKYHKLAYQLIDVLALKAKESNGASIFTISNLEVTDFKYADYKRTSSVEKLTLDEFISSQIEMLEYFGETKETDSEPVFLTLSEAYNEYKKSLRLANKSVPHRVRLCTLMDFIYSNYSKDYYFPGAEFIMKCFHHFDAQSRYYHFLNQGKQVIFPGLLHRLKDGNNQFVTLQLKRLPPTAGHFLDVGSVGLSARESLYKNMTVVLIPKE